MRFEGKNALITGGASGFGAATALKMAQEGAFVIIVDRDADKSASVMAQIEGSGGAGLVQHVELTSEESIKQCVEAVTQQISALHVLVNNAGIFRTSTIEDTNPDDWRLQVPINLQAPVFITRGLLPLMKKEGGAIVNISSDGAFIARPNSWVYDMTKAGVCSLTRTMAAEFWQYGIRVNNVAPGPCVTEMHYAHAPDPVARKKELEALDDERWGIMRRFGRPDEIANAILFLASDEASYITASTLNVDGGKVAR